MSYSKFDLAMVTMFTNFEDLLDSLDRGMLTVNLSGIRERPCTDSGYVYQAKNGMYYCFVRDNFFMEPGDNYTPMPKSLKR